MSQNDQQMPQNEESQQSKLPKPANLNHYFNKIQDFTKIWQLQAKLKPNRDDKFTKFVFKTNNNKVLGWEWLNNSRLKFETKQGKTKLSISSKLLDLGGQNYSNRKPKKQSNFDKQHRQDLQFLQQLQKKYKIKDSQQPHPQPNPPKKEQQPLYKPSQNRQKSTQQQLQVNLSTSYDNSKFNIKLKDKGQISFKFNQSVDIIPNSLKAQFQYIWDNKGKIDNYANQHKYLLEFCYTSGVARWITRSISNNINLDTSASRDPHQHIENLHKITKQITYRKNQTKLKTKLSNHSDTQIKLNSINHFGTINKQQVNANNNSDSNNNSQAVRQDENGQEQSSNSNSSSKKNKNSDKIRNQRQALKKQVVYIVISQHQHKFQQQQIAKIIDRHNYTYTQSLKTKLQLQNKLTLSRKSSQHFNFKTSINCQSVTHKQSVRLQTLISQTGFHNLQARYVHKYWRNWIFGGLLGVNWNTHLQEWNKKYEVVVERNGIDKIGNLCLSASNKYFGVRLIRKFNKNSKIQLMASRRWTAASNQWPKFGIKINLNL